MRLHHVQVACPPGGEDAVRAFYRDALGLREVEKPPELRDRGGAWFRDHDPAGAVRLEIHVGAEEAFAPARKAHPAIVLDSAADLAILAERLTRHGYEVDWSQQHTFGNALVRFHTHDAHGNRVEVLAPETPATGT